MDAAYRRKHGKLQYNDCILGSARRIMGQRRSENNEYFTASFLGEQYRKALSFCGSHSGRNCDKAKEAGITPIDFNGCVGFEESDMVLVCRKLYSYDMTENSFVTEENLAEKFYSCDPLHRAYIAEISAIYVKE